MLAARSALVATLSVKVAAMLITILIYFVDPDVFRCAPYTLPICAYIRKNNFYWVTLPLCSSYLVVLFVTVYVIKIILKQENTITPLVNLRASTSANRPLTISHSFNNNVQHNDQIMLEDLEIQIPQGMEENLNDPAFKDSRKRELIRRDEANPHIFYRQEQTNISISFKHLIQIV